MTNLRFKQIVESSIFGYIYYEVIKDKQNNIIDYKVVDVNSGFEKILGIKKQELMGQKILELFPEMKEDRFNWEETFRKVVEDGNTIEFEQYSDALNMWLKIKAFSPEEGYLVGIFNDVTGDRIISEISKKFNEFSYNNIDYQYILEKMAKLSGAKHGFFHIFTRNGRKFRTVAYKVGIKNIEKVISMLGFDFRNKTWDYDLDKMRKIKHQKITVFNELHELSGEVIPKPIINPITKIFSIGETVVVKLLKDNLLLGDFTLLFERERHLKNIDIIESYADLLGMLLMRIRAEEDTVYEERKLENIVYGMGAGTWEWNFETDEVIINDRFAEMLGYSIEELNHSSIEKFGVLTNNEDKEKSDKIFQKHLAGELEYYSVKNRMKQKNGEWIWVRIKGKIQSMTKDGRPEKLFGIAEDITSEIREDGKVKHQNKVLKSVREVSRILTSEKNIFKISPEICDILTRNRSYENVWMVIYDNNGNQLSSAQSNLDSKIEEIIEKLESNQLGCVNLANERDGIVTITEPEKDCINCSNGENHKDKGILIQKIKRKNIGYGYISVTISREYANDGEEQELFGELVKDVETAMERYFVEKQIQRLNNIIETVPYPMSFISKDYTYTAVNKMYEQYYEKDSSDIINKKISDFIGDDVFENEVKPQIDRCLKGEKVDYQICIYLSSLGLRYIDFEYIPFYGINGKIEGVVSIGKDVTEERVLKDKLEKEQENYKFLVENLNEGIWKIDKAGYTTFVNHKICEMMGYKYKELIGEKFSDFLDNDAKQLDKKIIEQRKKGVKSQNSIEVITKNQSKKTFLFEGSPIFDEFENYKGAIAGVVDITNIKNMEKELRISKIKAEKGEKLYRDTLSSISDTVLIINKKGEFLFVCPNISYNFKYSSEEIYELGNIDKLFEKNLFVEDEIPNINDEIKNREVKILNKYKKSLILILNIKRINYEEDEAFLISGRDITERKKLEDEIIKAKIKAEEANRIKSDFLANMSHEIRTPMNAIVGFSDLMYDKEDDDEKKETLKIITDSSQHLLTILNDILDLSKIEAGKYDIQEEKFDVYDTFKNGLQIYKDKIKHKGLDYILDIDDFYGKEVISDELSLLKIANNLISNSLKFTHKGFIKLSLKDKEDHIELMVEDSGIGINEKKKESLFTPFEQGEYYMTKKYGGTGLGLAIVKNVVELLNGEIDIKSEIDKGTTITVSIPAKIIRLKKLEESNVKKVKKTVLKNKEKLNIMSADDVEVNHKLIKRTFRNENVSIKKVYNGEEILEELEKSSDYDFILMDMQMPVLNGVEATKKIRKNPKYDNIKIIGISALAFQDDEKKGVDAGMDAYIKKPVEKDEIIEKINQFLE